MSTSMNATELTHTRPCDLEGEKQKVRRGKDKEGHFSLCVPDIL